MIHNNSHRTDSYDFSVTYQELIFLYNHIIRSRILTRNIVIVCSLLCFAIMDKIEKKVRDGHSQKAISFDYSFKEVQSKKILWKELNWDKKEAGE